MQTQVHTPSFPIFSTPLEELVNLPEKYNSYAVLAETERYVYNIMELHGFCGTITGVEEEITNWRVPEGALVSIEEIRVLPVYHPKDMIEAVKIIAEKSGDSVKKQLRDFHRIFKRPAEQFIEKVGTDPKDEASREVLEFLVRGAFHNYTDRKTLTQNAENFLFESDQYRIFASEKQNKPAKPVADKPTC